MQRSIFIWKLRPVIASERGLRRFVEKAQRARLSSVWIKVAVGASPYQNADDLLDEVVSALHDVEVNVCGWSEPRCRTVQRAFKEAEVLADLAATFHLDGVLMDAELPAGGNFFQGGAEEAEAYASTLRRLLEPLRIPLGLTSHDLPHKFPRFPFYAFARHAQINAPQVYYGGSVSVQDRFDRAVDANADVPLPMFPVGAAWVTRTQLDGGCESESAVVERAIAFMRLCSRARLPGYSFWYWDGAPQMFWDLLFEAPPEFYFCEPARIR